MVSRTSYQAEKGAHSTVIGIIVNFILAIIKGTAGVLGHSYALIADAIESASDVFSSIIIWSGLKIAAKPADKNHPYGHGKAEPLAASIVAIILVGAAFVIAIQSVREIMNPHHAPAPYTLLVLVLVVITKWLLFRYVITVGEDIKSIAVKTDAWHHRSDMLTSAAAFVGISIALIGGVGYENADDWAAIFAAGVILYNAIRLLRPAIGELMDESPTDGFESEVREIALSVKGVKALDKCFIRKLGFDHYVDIHVVVDGKMTVEEGHRLSHQVKETIKSHIPSVANVLVHIEPFREDYRKSR